jgi:hypothetical protein
VTDAKVVVNAKAAAVTAKKTAAAKSFQPKMRLHQG